MALSSAVEDRGRHMRIETAAAAFGIVDPITPSAVTEYIPALRCLVCTEDCDVTVEMVNGSVGTWPLIANVETPGMQIVKVTAVTAGTLRGLI